jgi:superoxide reductase
MAKKMEVYKCELCGNIVEMLHGGDGNLVCCGKDMKLMKENGVDAAKEKHVPVISKLKDKIIVAVGSVAHPMEDKHYIEWIELIVNDNVYRKYLSPGSKPEAEFCLCLNAANLQARAYCNLHGLWKS